MKTIALVIGISCYKDPTVTQLPGAGPDAERFKNALLSWGVPSDWVIHINDEQATKRNIIKTFSGLQKEFDVDTKFIFYFAGHGQRQADDNESTLVLHDTDTTALAQSGLRLVELMQLIRELKPVQTFLFIDACHLRLNSLINPLSTTNSKGLFGLFSSGILPSYEDVREKKGYFTEALLKAIDAVHRSVDPSCHDVAKKVAHELRQNELPLPETYHIGSSSMWLLDTHYSIQKTTSDTTSYVKRQTALEQLKERISSKNRPVIWLWGERGLGKTVIAEQLLQEMPEAVYTSVTKQPRFELSIIEAIRTQKSECFFNRPADKELLSTLQHLENEQPNTLIFIDHIDRLTAKQIPDFLYNIDAITLPCVLISRQKCPKKHFLQRKADIVECSAPAFSINEIEELIAKCNLEHSLSAILQKNMRGNALQIRQILVKMSQKVSPFENKMTQNAISCITAILACGGFLDEALFCDTFQIAHSTLSTLISYGLIRRTQNGFFPHDTVEDLVEENGWKLDFTRASEYWSRQILKTPYNRFACQSLVLITKQINSANAFKNALTQSLETLNDRQYTSYLVDLSEIFTKCNWQELVLQAAHLLVEHEEYYLCKEVIQRLKDSPIPSIRLQAVVEDIRRLTWIGAYIEAIGLFQTIQDQPLPDKVMIALRNNLGIDYFFLGKMDLAESYFRDNLAVSFIEDERELGISRYMLGMILLYTKDEIAQARELVESALLIFESTKCFHWLNLALNGMSDIAYARGKYHEAIFCLEKAREIALALQNKTFLLYTWRNLARSKLRLYDAHNPEIQECASILEELLHEVLQLGPTWATIWAQNTLCTIYAHQKIPEKMWGHLQIVSAITKYFDDCHLITLSNLGHYWALMNDLDQAKECYTASYNLCDKVHNPFARRELRQDFLACDLPAHLQ